MRVVEIIVKNVCGVFRGYPANEDANLFASLIAPRKTFHAKDVETIKMLGFEVETTTNENKDDKTNS